jgi:hypothetical protein
VITPQGSVKVLGVTLDKKLTMQAHIAKVADKATYACIALRSIKGLRPNQTRQIYRSCVTSMIDYAASTWYGTGKEGMAKLLKPLEKIQRLGARGILRAWNAASLPVLEAEAYLENTRTRLDRKVANHTAKIFTFKPNHPTRKATTFRKGQYRLCSPLQSVLHEHIEGIRPYGQTTLQQRPAWAKPPWIIYSNRIEIQERDKAIEIS